MYSSFVKHFLHLIVPKLYMYKYTSKDGAEIALISE